MDDKRQPSHSLAGAAIDDCWNRIGVRGDASCPRLVDYVHCRNCPVYACAAAMLLDRPLTEIDLMLCQDVPALPLVPRISTSATSGDTVDVDSLLVFRLGDEWLALPTRVFHQVTEMRRIHSLPHQRNRALLGIVNIRGALVVCASLGDLLGLEAVATPRANRRAVYQRLLVVRDHGQLAAFPVDEVDGIQRFARVARGAVPATVARAALTYTRAVVRWQGRTIGLLDADLLLETLNRGLT